MLAYSFTMVLPAIVTPPICVRSLPLIEAPVFNVMDCIAIMVPFITDVVPKVAELPTCQKILDADALPFRNTLRPEVVVNEEAIWIIKTALLFPLASKVRSPEDIAREEVDLYNPGVSVRPPIFPESVTISVLVRRAASLNAAVKSSLPCVDKLVLIWIVPTNIPGGNPPQDVPGLNPISPVIDVAPVFVMAEPAIIAKFDTPDNGTDVCGVF